MKIVGINGSPRKKQATSTLLSVALLRASECGVETEQVELSEYNITPCDGCQICFFKEECPKDIDDIPSLAQKLLSAQGVILASPTYMMNVSSLIKIMMERLRPKKMVHPRFIGKVGGAITVAGLRNGGQEITLLMLVNYLLNQGFIVVGPLNEKNRLTNTLGVTGTLYETRQEGKIKWRKDIRTDEIAIEAAESLGENMAELVKKLFG
jgi:multimeric flavodoxin WrbA